MDTLETIDKRIATTRNLQSIVRTMKSLSAVSVRQYERAVIALEQYSRTLELGFQVVISKRPVTFESTQPDDATVAVVFGSDHGLCGRFNEDIAGFAHSTVKDGEDSHSRLTWLTVGLRAKVKLEALGEDIDMCFFNPGAASGLITMAHNILLTIDQWRMERGIKRVLLFHQMRRGHVTASPNYLQLLPLDASWIETLAKREWPSHALPCFTMPVDNLFSSLVRQHLFAAVFRAGAESLASEHATRLISMQSAERNIRDRLEEMSRQYSHMRQESITEELLDVVAGFEVLQTKRKRRRNLKPR